MGRGSCKDCPRYDCEAFDPLIVPLAAASITPSLPAGVQPGDQLHVMANVPLAGRPEVLPYDPEGEAALWSDPPVRNVLARVLTDVDILELFEAWRCVVCGSRSWRRDRCYTLFECKSRWMEPVTVEIRRRPDAGG